MPCLVAEFSANIFPMENDFTDIDLMVQFQDGDDRCFEQLVERHKQRVFNIAFRYLGNVHDAEDAAQQVFINIYNLKKSYKPSDAQFTTWLYTVCKNTCLKTFRREKLKTISLNQSKELSEGSVPLQVADDKESTPVDDAISNETDKLVKEAIDALVENQKMVLILYKYDQLSYEDIAKVMGVSTKAVKSLLHRARVTLKEKLADYFNK
ncbi:MAG: RNA polymerase sigma factor [Candidatus Zapsychrus exili]|nr:RNA polymerase sigma factor [Candidatus Zapsychrus exili]